MNVQITNSIYNVLQQYKSMKLNDAFNWTLIDGLVANIESGTKLKKYGFII